MKNDWLKIGSVGINPDHIIAYNLDTTYKVPDGPAVQGDRGAPSQPMRDQRGVMLLLANGELPFDGNRWYQRTWIRKDNLVIGFDDGSPEADLVRKFFDPPTVKQGTVPRGGNHA